ncbi:hypothetical protein NO263_02150 [Gluconacetobacter entanii]|uniref:Uncharacterized protein n=2 Tax=Gluconacetobacter entanii TaxID=108528 RepID=A0ABT3K1V8_9PROT|nr:hypothetical protein [Gluconacetobacter entanii]MBE7619961.1 hypothetical protein [Komagataeibacter sp. FXV2]MCW4589389.1 hypothetical protein [Gluconacetobacter entanii]MCW4592792.1 hypothetical protein [Gluconacetobacter entanii]NPC87624.1 hypothetical protein [Gluconacetobacter entanii]
MNWDFLRLNGRISPGEQAIVPVMFLLNLRCDSFFNIDLPDFCKPRCDRIGHLPFMQLSLRMVLPASQILAANAVGRKAVSLSVHIIGNTCQHGAGSAENAERIVQDTFDHIAAPVSVVVLVLYIVSDNIYLYLRDRFYIQSISDGAVAIISGSYDQIDHLFDFFNAIRNGCVPAATCDSFKMLDIYDMRGSGHVFMVICMAG